jgi:dephospho-CoA kinase
MLVITGMPGAGKDEFVKVAKELGWKDIHMGNTVKAYAAQNNIVPSDSEIGQYASGERKRFGMDIWAKRTSQKIEDPDHTIVDGLRNTEELEYFRSSFRNVKVIAIYANMEDRLTRIRKRRRPDDITDESGLIKRDTRELDWGIGKTISLADHMIVNDQSLEEFRDKSRSLLMELSKN